MRLRSDTLQESKKDEEIDSKGILEADDEEIIAIEYLPSDTNLSTLWGLLDISIIKKKRDIAAQQKKLGGENNKDVKYTEKIKNGFEKEIKALDVINSASQQISEEKKIDFSSFKKSYHALCACRCRDVGVYPQISNHSFFGEIEALASSRFPEIEALFLRCGFACISLNWQPFFKEQTLSLDESPLVQAAKLVYKEMEQRKEQEGGYIDILEIQYLAYLAITDVWRVDCLRLKNLGEKLKSESIIDLVWYVFIALGIVCMVISGAGLIKATVGLTFYTVLGLGGGGATGVGIFGLWRRKPSPIEQLTINIEEEKRRLQH